jgi:hypothetical protein
MAPDSPSVRLDELAKPRLKQAAVAFRDGLRDARSEVLADAEGFMVVVASIERLGKWLAPGGTGFGQYEHGLRLLVQATGVADVPAFARDLCVLRESRNDTAHGGAAARHAADEALRVSVVLEEALMVLHTGWDNVTAEHVMTRNPVVAEPWQLVAEVRRVMLTRGFTALPYRAALTEPWKVVSDEALARWLHQRDAEGELRRRAGPRLDFASATAQGLAVEDAAAVGRDAPVAVVAQRRGLRLVTTDGTAMGHLLGVIAPADLL